jgi:hypothetical protein
LILFLVDYELTMWHQPDYYWDGWYDYCNEANPLSYRLMTLHPFAMIVASVVYLGVFCTAIIKLPRHTALYASLALTLGHAFGAGTWAYNYYGNGMALALTLFTAAVCTIAFELWAADGVFAPTLRKWSAYTVLVAGAPAVAALLPSETNYAVDYSELRIVNQSGVSCRVVVDSWSDFGYAATVANGVDRRLFTTPGGVYVRKIQVTLGSKVVETVLDLKEEEVNRVWLTITPDGTTKVRKE